MFFFSQDKILFEKIYYVLLQHIRMSHPCHVRGKCNSFSAYLPYWQPLYLIVGTVIVGCIILMWPRKKKKRITVRHLKPQTEIKLLGSIAMEHQ